VFGQLFDIALDCLIAIDPSISQTSKSGKSFSVVGFASGGTDKG
jgi:hypothetical protein